MKEVLLSVIAGQKHDYKVCCNCGSFIWYEDDYCSNCCDKTKMRSVTKKDIINEEKFWKEQNKDYNTDNIMITLQ